MADSSTKTARCRNSALDFLKGLACIGVVVNHMTEQIMFRHWLVTAIVVTSYFAVPIFFMITGFYAYQADDRTIIRRLRKIFRITLFAILIYAVYTLQHMIRYDGLPVGITLSDIAQTAARFVILSDCRFMSANHLWYLVSLIE